MKKRISLFVVFMVCVMIAGCGRNAASAQKPADQPKQETAAQKPADQSKQETANQPRQETADQKPADQPDDSNQEVAISDVKHWKIEKGTLLGQIGPADFIKLADLPTDSGIRDYAKVVTSSEENNKLLIKQDAAFYRFDLTSNQATLINPGAYDAYFDSDAVYFIKPDGSEYVIKDWEKGDIMETANSRVSYNVIPNSYRIDGFDEFPEIQEYIKNGDYKAAFDKGYIVEANGDIYDFYNHYITNAHLPEAYAGNTYAAGDCTAIIKEGKLNVYRYGGELTTIELPSGSFVVVDVFLQNGTVASALLYNFDNCAFYKAEAGSVEKVFSDVKDYFAKDGQIFWVDNNNSGHVCNWFFDQNDALVAEDITGVSHYRDFPGFVVDEEQGEEFNGLHILVY